jgi:hypothetical protein
MVDGDSNDGDGVDDQPDLLRCRALLKTVREALRT